MKGFLELSIINSVPKSITTAMFINMHEPNVVRLEQTLNSGADTSTAVQWHVTKLIEMNVSKAV
jgi:hypothetical protein